MDARVYQYGITHMPSRLPDLAFEQAIKRHKLYNKLVEIEQANAEKYAAIIATASTPHGQRGRLSPTGPR